jgi:ADP-ribose pyrophosphatase YjhB (NUDIX family)
MHSPTSRRTFSVAVYPRRSGRVLVILHRRLGTWLPPGGEVEIGETPLEAARRERREETGLQGDFAPLAGAARSPRASVTDVRSAPPRCALRLRG